MRRTFSTDDIAESDPVDYWRSWLSNEFQPVDISDYEPSGFNAHCDITSVGDIDITRFKGSSQCFRRSQSMARTYNADAYVVVVADAPTAFDHNGRNARCNGGDIVLFDATRPYVVAHGPSIGVLSVTIPRLLFEGHLGGSHAASGLALDGGAAGATIVRNYLQSLEKNGPELKPETARRMSSIAVDLIAAAFSEKLVVDGPPRSRRGVKIQQTRAFIEHNLANNRLDAAMVAAAMGVSQRRLHEIFETENESVSDHIWESRLLRAYSLIAEDPRGHATISAIAYRVGFASPAHFARRFKERFGCTPSEVRGAIRQHGSKPF